MIGCCNELNAGYAVDGYCRETGGLGVGMVTYCVGGLSIINAVAGAYSEDLPFLMISGGPNTNDSFQHHLIHHTIGERDIYQSHKCFEPVVSKTFVIRHIDDVAEMVDGAIDHCLRERKPVYLEVPCNLVRQMIPAPTPITFGVQRESDPEALDSAVEDILRHIDLSVKPVLVAGPKLKVSKAIEEFTTFAEAFGCGVASSPDAKGVFNEDHPSYMGTWWTGISSPHVSQVVCSSDLMIFAGPIFNDYTTTGWSSLLPRNKIIDIQPNYVTVCGVRYGNVRMADVLDRLSKVPSKPFSLETFQRYREADVDGGKAPPKSKEPLKLSEFRRQLQEYLSTDTSLVVETGDSWFIGQFLKLPEGCRYHVQMQYGSIGWSVGATLGVALASGDSRRVIALIGDGSFQMTAQEVSTMIRQGVKCTILLLNNKGYTIEVEIHDGPYNDTKNWDYAQLVDTFNAEDGNGLGLKAKTAQELADALEKADKHDGLALIEVALDRDDCTEELLLWGAKVASSNGRP